MFHHSKQLCPVISTLDKIYEQIDAVALLWGTVLLHMIVFVNLCNLLGKYAHIAVLEARDCTV